ncbi:MAG: SpaA isopeptide-forming pilin-related protein, partial [Finegoldia magna]|uniref:SpaA isopeptide-forming pilin-related protein n=1 Tax=Finegoldia magna TaxID=1260 RepID=UPI0029011F8D
NRFDKNKLFAIEVISKYTPGTNLGLGLDYYYKRSGAPSNWLKYWGAQSYTSADAINREAYGVIATSQGHGTVTANPSKNIAKDTQVTVNVNPDQGYELQSLIVDRQDVTQSVSNNQYTFGMPSHNVNVEASFKEKTPEQVTVSFSAGEGSGTMAEQKVNVGSDYKLPANGFDEPSGKKFKAWSVNNEEKNPGDFITVNANTTVTAIWKDKASGTYNITVNNPQEGGTVTADKTSATAGTEITLTVKPKEGYELQSLTVGDKDVTTSVANNQYKFKMPANNVTISANFKAADMGTEIPAGKAAQITNNQVGIELKVHKRNNTNEGLDGAKFTLKKYTDKTFTQVDTTFTDLTATSDDQGNVVFKDRQDKTVKLNTGYYILEETKSPVGYKKAAAPWKLQVKEENGSLVIVQNGPEKTAASFLTSDKAVAADNQNGKIKYKSIVKNIDPDSKTFVQRVYIDTRAYGNVVNVQITPKHKREEIDRPGEPPVTITEGVKTAYRSTYQITNPPANVDVDKVLNSYDLRDPNVTTVNTARWRPFDWGFDEDLLNLEPGVYYIDIEGYYDGSIVDKKVTNEVAIDGNYNFTKKDRVTPSAEPVLKDPYVRDDIPEKDLGKLDLHIDFYDGERQFQEAYNKGGTTFAYRYVPQGSYQHGATNIRNWYKQSLIRQGYGEEQAETYANNWANRKLPEQKYPNYISKKVKINRDDRNWLDTGIIYPPLTNPVAHADTSLDISSLYTSNKAETVPQEGMSITNEREVYNITFSKHKMDGDDNTNRLEGAVFKLQKKEGSFWYDLDESYVSSAFNGYFGFRRLEPGTYRLIEVAPPKGYRALDGTLLEFVIKTIDPKGEIIKKDDGKTYDIESGLEVQVQPDGTHKVVDPKTGKIVESANGYVTIEYKRDNYLIPNVKDDETSTGKLVDFVTSATAKNIGKVRNEEPGKGSVTIKKVDENGDAIPGKKNESGELIAGAKFRATRLGAKTGEDGKPVTDAVYEGRVGTDGTLKFEGLPLGNYELREIESPNGYINTGQVWHFTVGGKGLDPYADDASPRTRNITSLIELTSSDMIVNRPYDEDTTQGTNEIRPHVGQSLQFTNKYKIKDGVKISAGDYFVLKLTDNMDLHGIREDKPTNLDLFADGIGTLAKADYNRQAGTITYTFTKAAEQYTVTDFKNVISAHINLNKVRNSSNQEVGMSVGNDTSKLENIYVNYILDIEYGGDGSNFINMASKIVRFNSETGEFVHYFYVNREGQYDGKNLTFRYKPNQTVNNLQITTYDLYYTDNNSKIQSMPASFGVNENDRNLWRYGITQPKTVEANKTTTTNIGNYPYNRASIVKVTGKIANTKNLTEYRGNSALYYGYNYTDNYGYQRWAEYPSVYRWDGVYVFENESTAKANFELPITNPSNKVVFEKVNTEGQVLKPTVDETGKVTKGAKFTLEKNDGTIENPAATWTAKTNPTFVDKDGRISYNHLEKGLYRLIENEAPEGYANPNGPVAYLKVDDSGKIYQKVTVPNADETGTAEIYQEISETIPIKVVNNKPIEFVKVDATDKTFLKGAEFEVHYKEKETDPYQAYEVDGKVVTAKSDENGKFTIPVSKDGYYALEETKAPDGYSKFPGYIKEFKLENGKLKVLEKSSKQGTVQTDNNIISSQTIEVNEKDKTFKQRIILNPNQKKWEFDGGDTQLRLYEDQWTVNTTGKKIRYAVLDENRSISELKEGDYKEFNPRNSSAEPLMYAVARMYGENNYTKPSTTSSGIYTNKSLVVEFTGKLKDNATSPINVKMDVNSDQWKYSELTYSLDYEKISKEDKIYVDYESKDPIKVENRKGEYPLTGAMGIIGFLVAGAVIMTTAYYKYRRKRRESALS